MKLPITEKFLWTLYSLSEISDDALTYINPLSSKYEFWREYQKEKGQKAFSKLVSHLKRKGYIEVPELKERKGFMLTSKGKERVLKIKHKFIKRKKRDDKRWEMVIFDIPEKEKHHRNALRAGLERLGYQQLQKSIWVSPYDVLSETQELIKTHDVIDYTRLLLIEEIALSKNSAL